MNEVHKDFWFPVKRYGWGWGSPVKWQGWFIIALFVGSVVVAGMYFPPRRNPSMFAVSAGVSTIVFVAIVVFKGEKPLAWRWNKE